MLNTMKDRYRIIAIDLEKTLSDPKKLFSVSINETWNNTFETLREAEVYMQKVYLATEQKYFSVEDNKEKVYNVYDAQQEIHLGIAEFGKSGTHLTDIIREREEE